MIGIRPAKPLVTKYALIVICFSWIGPFYFVLAFYACYKKGSFYGFSKDDQNQDTRDLKQGNRPPGKPVNPAIHVMCTGLDLHIY